MYNHPKPQTGFELLDMIERSMDRKVLVQWSAGPCPDTTKHTAYFCTTNEIAPNEDAGWTFHHLFPVEGVEHARVLFNEVCGICEQPEKAQHFSVKGVDQGRAMFIHVRYKIG